MYRSVPKGSGPVEARFNQLSVVRYTNDIFKAIGHSTARNARVVQTACFFSLIRSTTPDISLARVLIEAAQRRMFSSPEGYEAAHYLPCQLTIQAAGSANAALPWNYVSKPNARQRLEDIFADVENLPTAYNKADSASEAKGLRETFRALGENVLRDPTTPLKGRANKALIRRLYDEIWTLGALKSYDAAVAQKMLVSDVPPIEYEDGNITNLTERSTADWSRENEVAILQRYSEALRTPPPDLSDGKIADIEKLFAQ